MPLTTFLFACASWVWGWLDGYKYGHSLGESLGRIQGIAQTLQAQEVRERG